MATVLQQRMQPAWGAQGSRCLLWPWCSAYRWCHSCCCSCILIQHTIPAHPCPSQRTWQVFSKGAKFSMFKPAEEMVYIGLDAESRTKGKAAIDVVGAQTGKSGGSVLQQVQWAEANPRLRGGIAECHAAHSSPVTSCLQVAGAHCCAISPHAGRHMQALSARHVLRHQQCAQEVLRASWVLATAATGFTVSMAQVLLVVGGGQLAKSLPLISAVYTAMLLAWSGAVQRLDKLHVVDFSSHKGAPRKDQEAPGKPSSMPCPPDHSRGHNGNGPLNMAGAGPASAA